MPKKPMIMKLTVDDFIWLGEQFGMPENQMKNTYASLQTAEQKQNYFYELMMSNPRKWEYVRITNKEKLRKELDDLLPMEIRIDGDLDKIEDYAAKNQDTLKPQAKCMLLERMASLKRSKRCIGAAENTSQII